MQLLFKMKNKITNAFPLILILVLILSCGDLTQKAEDKLNELNEKTNQLDSIVNTELDKVKKLDTLIESELQKVKKLDSLVNKRASKLEYLANDKLDKLKIFK